MQGGRRADPRLPLIAPRQEVGPSTASQTGLTTSGISLAETRRSRVPPRSRSGCWTCRTRKVKCDELRPVCTQCVRLGHTCDYNPRVSFKDDTPRVLERMQEVSTAGSYVWDPNTPEQVTREFRAIDDSLPPFSTLQTDDEREKKAETRDPGTYVVVANPMSFADLPEYNENASTFGERRESHYSGIEGDNESHASYSTMEDPDDPNVVILKTFEDPFRSSHPPVPGGIPHRPTATPASPTLSHVSLRNTQQSSVHEESNASNSTGNAVNLLDTARRGGKDADLLNNYRALISPQIVSIENSAGDEDMFEIEARNYPPLFHAMMALSALSIAHKRGVHHADALEHYQKVIPALQRTVQSTQDSYADGALLTHLILLFYEIASASQRESNMWQHHCDQLLRIIILRRQAYNVDRYDFVTWMIYCIDVYALLSASGTGAFVEVVLQQNILPSPERCLPPVVVGQRQVIFPEEQSYFPALIRANQEVIVLALQIGRLAQVLRAETAQRLFENPPHLVSEGVFTAERRRRVQSVLQLMDSSRHRWRLQFPDYKIWLERPEHLPPRVFEWVQHSYLLLKACQLYAYTSMYPGQLGEHEADFDSIVHSCCSEILRSVSIIHVMKRFDMRFIVFPIFMAGFSTRDLNEKDIALRFMIEIERHGYGRSTESVRKLLQTVYEKQRVAVMQMGNSNAVDWVEEMELSGQRLIIYGI